MLVGSIVPLEPSIGSWNMAPLPSKHVVTSDSTKVLSSHRVRLMWQSCFINTVSYCPSLIVYRPQAIIYTNVVVGNACAAAEIFNMLAKSQG